MAYPSNPEKGFDVQYKLYDQMQWEDANVTLFTFSPVPFCFPSPHPPISGANFGCHPTHACFLKFTR